MNEPQYHRFGNPSRVRITWVWYYNQRSRVEAQIGRWKGVIGSKLKAWNFLNQKTEVRIGISILNKMTELGRPEFEAIT